MGGAVGGHGTHGVLMTGLLQGTEAGGLCQKDMACQGWACFSKGAAGGRE